MSSKQIFVNLPVKDLKKSMAFFSGLGYSFNAQFTDDNAACMVISEQIFAMLITEPRFRDFTPKKIVDAHDSTEVLIALSTDSRADVDKLVDKALSLGGKEIKEPQDYGFMYYRSFQDLDGHIWETLYMDPSHVQ
ncbi:VOC family protein [Uliginosibacterium sp. H1]|uniref:VOC family protein n=1 Tax=Uliginosibacterium sp. H1 TaxID=3114757 RepID=UPI002E1836F4|nr:VOC family protein [Uliginosibacterium sp. H1]